MARKIKLPLDMGNDIKVRDIDELKENYNSEKVVEYFLSGELLSWLNDRFYDDEAEKVEALSADKDSGNVAGKLAEIFGVQIEGEVDVDEIAERKERLEKLRKITSDDEVLRNVDLVAFSQEDMDIVHESDVIYLCGEKFRIPYSMQNKRYIGVNEPLVEISTSGEIDLEGRGIVIEGCRFTEETEARLQNTSKIVEEGLAYLNEKDYEKAAQCFKKAAENGNHEAEFQYGKMFENGTGVEKDRQLARQWYSKAAADGSAKACNNLGNMCKDDKKYDQALAWFKKGLEIEERPTLLYNLGRAYISEEFNINDNKEAEMYLLKAAEKGFKLAYSELAELYINDSYTVFDINKSEYWRSKCLDDSDEFDFEELADKFFDDTLPGHDVEKALKYYELAIETVLKKDPEDECDQCTDLRKKKEMCLQRMNGNSSGKIKSKPETKDLDSISVKGIKGGTSYLKKLTIDDDYLEELGVLIHDDDSISTVNLSYKYAEITIDDSFNDIWRHMNLDFQNCIIHVPYTENDLISFCRSSRLTFRNCTFVSEAEYESDLRQNYVFTCGCGDSEFEFRDCLFLNVNYLISYSDDSSSAKILFTGCHFINCYCDIINYFAPSEYIGRKRKNTINISKCVICQDGENMFCNEDFFYDDPVAVLFNSGDNYELTATNNLIMQPEDTGLVVLKIFKNSGSQVTGSRYALPSDASAVTSFWREV